MFSTRKYNETDINMLYFYLFSKLLRLIGKLFNPSKQVLDVSLMELLSKLSEFISLQSRVKFSKFLFNYFSPSKAIKPLGSKWSMSAREYEKKKSWRREKSKESSASVREETFSIKRMIKSDHFNCKMRRPNCQSSTFDLKK